MLFAVAVYVSFTITELLLTLCLRTQGGAVPPVLQYDHEVVNAFTVYNIFLL